MIVRSSKRKQLLLGFGLCSVGSVEEEFMKNRIVFALRDPIERVERPINNSMAAAPGWGAAQRQVTLR